MKAIVLLTLALGGSLAFADREIKEIPIGTELRLKRSIEIPANAYETVLYGATGRDCRITFAAAKTDRLLSGQLKVVSNDYDVDQYGRTQKLKLALGQATEPALTLVCWKRDSWAHIFLEEVFRNLADITYPEATPFGS